MNQVNYDNYDYDDFTEIEDMLTSDTPLYDMLQVQKLLRKKILNEHRRILVVEDDPVFEPVWEHIIASVDPKIEFSWVSTPIQAQELIHRSNEEGKPYDLIISDIYLSSTITGIDLWNRFGNENNFLLISSIDNYKIIEQAKNVGKTPPPYIQKPLNEKQCASAVKSLINPED